MQDFVSHNNIFSRSTFWDSGRSEFYHSNIGMSVQNIYGFLILAADHHDNCYAPEVFQFLTSKIWKTLKKFLKRICLPHIISLEIACQAKCVCLWAELFKRHWHQFCKNRWLFLCVNVFWYCTPNKFQDSDTSPINES